VAQICGLGAALPGFEFAGAAYHGVGIPDCILGGERAAQAIFSGLHPEIAEARAGSQ
jgi:oxygen-dependent protoporphyrinogen oxidase